MTLPMEPAAPASAVQLQAPEGASLVQLLLILRRRWRLLAILWVATVAATAVYTFTSRKLYRPQASLEIRPESPLVSTDSQDPALMASRMMWENYYRTQEAILTSPTLLEATLKALPQAIQKDYEGLPDPLKAFSDKLDIEKVRTSFILKVGFVDPSPETATQVVNTLVSLYLADANRRLRDLKSGAVEILSKEALPSMREKVDAADRKLQAFQKSTGFMDFEERYKLLIEKYRKYDAGLTDLVLKKRRLRAELDALGSYGADGIGGLFNPAFHSTRSLEPLSQQRSRIAAELAREEKVFREKHPRVVELREELRMVEEKVREAIRGTLRALETDLAAVEQEEKGLAGDVAAVTRQMEEVGGHKWEYRQLEGDLASAKDLYSSYLKKHGETTATSGASLGSVRIVDHATIPAFPYKPRVMTNLALGAVLGILLGLAAMFVTEQLDDRIVSEREIEAFIGLDVLAVIPNLDAAAKAAGKPVLLGKESNLSEIETFRALRSEVLTRMEGPASKVVAVLSALESEGKSTVSVNLAAVLALEGRRVLLLDADLRRPAILALLGSADGPGLSAVLRGEVPVDQAIQKSRLPGVDLLGEHQGIPTAAELVGSARLDDVLAHARPRYDFVIIDLAPVNLVSESSLVARRADAALLVVRAFRTGRGAALQAIKRLRGMRVHVLGAVLNGANVSASSYGYYLAGKA